MKDNKPMLNSVLNVKVVIGEKDVRFPPATSDGLALLSEALAAAMQAAAPRPLETGVLQRV
jgi:hypothetical protein